MCPMNVQLTKHSVYISDPDAGWFNFTSTLTWHKTQYGKLIQKLIVIGNTLFENAPYNVRSYINCRKDKFRF